MPLAFSACLPAARAPPHAGPVSPRGATAPRLSRRALGCALVAAVLRSQAANTLSPGPALAADAAPGLPGGAAEFSRVLSARTRWGEVGQAISAGSVSADEWQSTRAFLRAFYSIAADMRFLAKPWDKPLRSRAEKASRMLEKKVKAMDGPAKEGDVETFLKMHEEADAIVGEFFAAFAEASAGDMPAEL